MTKISISTLGFLDKTPLEAAEFAFSCGADTIHLDVMDGKFVEPTVADQFTLKELKEKINLPIDVHLMAVNPQEILNDYLEIKPNSIAIHFESSTPDSIVPNISMIKKANVKAGMAINPQTKLKEIDNAVLDIIDYLLIMSVEPGYSGQQFIENSLEKIATYDQLSARLGRKFEIYVDGGINETTGLNAVLKGANCLVIGSAFYKNENPAEFLNKVKAYSKQMQMEL